MPTLLKRHVASLFEEEESGHDGGIQEEANTNELLKVDRRGHVRVSAQRREMLLEEFKRCGVSVAEHAGAMRGRYVGHWLPESLIQSVSPYSTDNRRNLRITLLSFAFF